VLRSLIAYLRAAVPLLHEPVTTLDREVQMVEAYLALMHLRMPDRLRFEVRVEEAARPLRCPRATLLTLVENAVRHGVDPSEEGGSIDIEVRRRGDRCVIRVRDDGVGLRQTDQGLGTGLSRLREGLRLMFGADAQLAVQAQDRRGVCAEVSLPAREWAR
jgi:LytS/YehU family sensor histidine kinase